MRGGDLGERKKNFLKGERGREMESQQQQQPPPQFISILIFSSSFAPEEITISDVEIINKLSP